MYLDFYLFVDFELRPWTLDWTWIADSCLAFEFGILVLRLRIAGLNRMGENGGLGINIKGLDCQ